MTLELITIPCLADNYAFLLHAESGETALIDAPEAGPILAELDARGWSLTHLFLTHHHWDHIDGVPGILEHHQPKVIGAARDAHRLPALTEALAPGDTTDFAGHRVEVMEAHGHTTGHIAFHIPDARMAFTGDSLMALGCGRLFEGSPADMWQSLSGFKALPADTLICSGHEYTEANGRFAVTIEPDNAALAQRNAETARARQQGKATVPSLLSTELATNPFLRADLPEVKTALGMENAPDEKVFAEIRARKDRF
ncbi:MAG: hydroxyacylglutathione hydrolase [Rhodobacterales bacterium]|nr:MAG: hydroxyacylglutathione hydrolase [Rhodobacterales bacterium]